MKKNNLSNLILVYFLIISLLIFSIHLSTPNFLPLWNNISNNKIMPSDKPLSSSYNLQSWNYTTGGTVWEVSISADGEYFAAGSGDYKLYLFEKTSSSPYWIYSGNNYFGSVAISANGQYIVAGGGEARFYLFNRGSSTPLWNYSTGWITRGVAISADGQFLVALDGNWHVHLCNRSDPTPIWSYQLDRPVRTVDISADGQYIITGTGLGLSPDNITLFNRTSPIPLWNYTIAETLTRVAISADGNYIVAGCLDDRVYLFNKNSSTPLWNFTASWCIDSVDISADGQYIVAGCWDKKVFLFHRDNSTPLWSYTTGDDISSVAISAGGQYLAAGSQDNKVYLFHKDNSTPLWKHTTGGWIESIAFSTDGHQMVFGSRDGGIYFFQNITESISPKPGLAPLLILMLEQPEFNVFLIPLILGIVGVAIFLGIASYFKVKKGFWPWKGKITINRIKQFFGINKGEKKSSKLTQFVPKKIISPNLYPKKEKHDKETIEIEKKVDEELLNSINNLNREELLDFISNFLEDLKAFTEINNPNIISAENWLVKIKDYLLSKLTLVDAKKLTIEIQSWERFLKEKDNKN